MKTVVVFNSLYRAAVSEALRALTAKEGQGFFPTFHDLPKGKTVVIKNEEDAKHDDPRIKLQ